MTGLVATTLTKKAAAIPRMLARVESLKRMPGLPDAIQARVDKLDRHILGLFKYVPKYTDSLEAALAKIEKQLEKQS